MRIINISFALFLVLSSFKGSFGMAIKGLEPEPESSRDCSSDETTKTPEATNVRSKNPESDSLNDAAQPQLPKDLKEPESPSPITPIIKRCTRSETVGSSRGHTLSLARRDLTARKIQQCEACKNGKLCKERGKCTLCKALCKDVETTTPSTIEVVTDHPEEQKREITDAPLQSTNEEDTIVTSRFQGGDEELTLQRYYSLGAVEKGALMRLFAKIFNIPEGFEKLIVLGKMKGSTEGQNVNNIAIIDLAQVFGSSQKVEATVHKFSTNSETITADFISNLNKRLDDAIAKSVQGGTVNTDEMQRIIDETMKEENDNVGSASETATRCSSMEEAVEDLLHIVPVPIPQQERSKSISQPTQKQIVEPLSLESEESSEEFPNPPVIQDNFNLANKPDEYVDDNGESAGDTNTNSIIVGGVEDDNEEVKPKVIAQFTVPKTKPALQDVHVVTMPKEAETLIIPDEARPRPLSDNQMNVPSVQGRANSDIIPDDLERNIVNIVEDSLKAASTRDSGTIRESETPSDALEEEVIRIVDDSLKTLSNVPNIVQSENPALTREPVFTAPSDLEKNVKNIIDDSLKTASSVPTMLQSENPASNTRPSLEKNVVQIVDDSLKTLSNVPSTIQSREPSVLNLGKKSVGLKGQNIVQSESPASDLEQNVVQIVDDSLKAVSQSGNLENQGGSMVVGQSQAASESVSTMHEHSGLQKDVQPIWRNAESRSDLVAMEPSGFENRAQEKSNYFGSLIPAKDISTDVTDPKVKKLYYVGDNINLPLKMIQDENGVMKLRVDTDALCNCKSGNCTRQHINEKFRSALRENEDEDAPVLPELNVKFGRDEDLMNSFVDSLHDHSESSDIFKRSAKMDEDVKKGHGGGEKVELENEIEKLNDDIEKMKATNRNLLNRGTVALFKDVEKTKDVDRMITLAADLLSWMKDFSMKHLD